MGRNIPGVEFWDSATGGNRLWPDANGYIVNDSLACGEDTHTLWCSGDLATAPPPDPETGDPEPVDMPLMVESPTGKNIELGPHSIQNIRNVVVGQYYLSSAWLQYDVLSGPSGYMDLATGKIGIDNIGGTAKDTALKTVIAALQHAFSTRVARQGRVGRGSLASRSGRG